MNCLDGVRNVGNSVAQEYRNASGRPFLLGIAGPVGVGKTRFAMRLIAFLRSELPLVPVVHIPFDYWINRAGLYGKRYADRFFLEELEVGLRAIIMGLPWMCPRHDLLRKGIDPDSMRYRAGKNPINHEARMFFPVNEHAEIDDVPFGSGVYLDPKASRFYSRCVPRDTGIYLVDGTLIFQNPAISACYSKKVYVEGAWGDRVARMMRRHGRKEVFGATTTSELEYVAFLVDEARNCADEEVEAQRTEDMTIVTSSLESISSFLDLHRLLELIARDSEVAKAYHVTTEEVTVRIKEAKKAFATRSATHLAQLKNEFTVLSESKHLLQIENVHEIFSDLEQVLG